FNNVVEFEGQPAVLSTSIDISARRRALDDAALFRSLIDRSGDAVLVLDPRTWRILDANAQAWTGRGDTRDELLALTIRDLNPSHDQRGRGIRLEAIVGGGVTMFETVHRRKDGTTFPVEVSASYVHLDREYVISAVRDVSERRRIEAALREREE